MKFGRSIFKTFFVSLCIIANTAFAYAQTASILPPAKTTFVDQNGKPLTSGTVDFYVPGTTTRKTTWQDSAKTVPNTNPVVLDAAGRGIILGDGAYRQIVKDRYNNLIWDQVTSSLGSGGSSGSTIGDGLPVGTILPTSGVIAPVNYQFAYGQALSRTTYPELFAALTVQANITCTGGSAIIAVTDTSSFSVGTVLESICAAGSPTIISKTSSTITLSTNSTITVATIGRFFPYGNGDALTTFNAPDLRGNVIAGRCNMGGVDCANLNSTYFSTNVSNTPSAVNAKGGSQSHTLTANESAVLTYSTIYGTKPQQAYPTSQPTVTNGGGSAQGLVWVGSLSNLLDLPTLGTMTTTSNAGGQAHSIIQPTLTLNYIVKVTPDINSSTTFGVASIGGMTGVITCGANVTCAGNNISVTIPTGSVSSIGGMTGAIACGNGIFCGSSTVRLAQNTAVSNQYVSGVDASGNITRASFPASTGKTPADYGAACDGVTDDSIAIQAWLDAIRNGAFIGQGIPFATCLFGNNTNYAAPGLMGVHEKTTIRGNYMTLKLKNSAPGSSNAGLVWFGGTGSPDQVTGADNVNISELIIDGNRANQTNTLGSGALMYVIASTGVTLTNTSTINGRGDGLYTGGSTALPFAKKTSQVSISNHFSSNNYRTGWSIVGVNYLDWNGGIIQATGNTNSDGTQCGVDFEPDSANSSNADITVRGLKVLSNNTGNLVGSGGICANINAVNANTIRTILSDIVADSNNQYGININTGGGDFNDISIVKAKGAANTVGLLGGQAWDIATTSLPTTKTSNYTILNTDTSLIFNGAGSITVTLPAANTQPNRSINLKTIAAQAVVSASSNIVPIGSAGTTTAILSAAAGRYVTLQSDGTNWVTISGNP